MTKDIIIIGAGIIGLATALKISDRNPNLKILIIEKEDSIAKHQTGNNSGVIHSGIYYKPGSLKAINCKTGYEKLLRFCNENDIEYEICGKVIVATANSQIQYLNQLYERGQQNGLKDLKKLNKNDLKEIEPHVEGVEGIFVPQTGIINFSAVCEKYLKLLIERGAEIVFDTEVKKIINHKDGIEVSSNDKSYSCRYLVSCAGLHSDRIAKMTHPNLNIRIIPFRGEYYKLKPEKRNLVNTLIYPVPDPAFPFLGVHFTRMIDGGVECGPNAVLAFKREGYKKSSFNLKDSYETFSWSGFRSVMKKYWKTGMGEFYRSYSKKAFVRALQKLIPEITENDLEEGGAGVRAQACDNNGKLLDDFYIVEDKNIFHVCNAPSPAATSSLSIGEHIADKIFSTSQGN